MFTSLAIILHNPTPHNFYSELATASWRLKLKTFKHGLQLILVAVDPLQKVSVFGGVVENPLISQKVKV